MEHKSQNVICQNCKASFVIEPEDFNFYEKINVPPPTWCPECRLMRRLAYREDRSLYKNKCSQCNKDIVSIFSLESKIKVFCSPCWWGDSWEASQFAKEYDFNKPFFDQFNELQKSVPREATSSRNSTNCQFSNGNVHSKNCMLTFDSFECINCYNCKNPAFTRDSMDSDFTMNGDHVYETVNSNGVYNTKFVFYSDECLDSSFLFSCVGCSNCFGCVNLRNKSYYIWNKQYSKEAYKKEIKKWNLGSFKKTEEARKKFLELYYKTPRKFSITKNSVNVSGDDIKNTKNCKSCFSTRMGVENSKFIFLSGLLLKDSYDVTFGGDNSELFYEHSGGMQSQRSFFCRAPNNSSDVQYSDRVFTCSNIFGCVHLKNKKYCILNKQYTKEEYEELLPKIIKHMNDMPYVDKKGRIYKYGEFFPIELSLWAYNETWAQKYFPLTKEEALEKGFNWHDEEDKNYEITIKAENLPDNIKDVSDKILEEIIECQHKGECNQLCTKAFKILPNELQFYKQMNLALPRLCPSCRYEERIKSKNPMRLWHRKCMCNGIESTNMRYKNTTMHNHGDSPCPNEFETAISDKREEIVYCEKCYQDEFI